MRQVGSNVIHTLEKGDNHLNKTLIIGNHASPNNKIITQAERLVFHTKISKSIPITTQAILSLTKDFDEIVIQHPLYTNDQLIQGGRLIVNEFVYNLFRMVAIETNIKLYIQTGNELLLINKETFTSLHDLKKFSQHSSFAPSKHTVTSVQKWQTTSFHQANDLAYEYYSWIGSFTKKVIKVDIKKDEAYFRLFSLPYPLLVLKKVPQISTNISEWEIKSGILNKKLKKKKAPLGRLWFIVNDDQCPSTIYSALTHFKPALPWPIYRLTQSILHPFVMNQFKKHHID